MLELGRCRRLRLGLPEGRPRQRRRRRLGARRAADLREHLWRLCDEHGIARADVESLRGYRLPLRRPGATPARGRIALVGDAAGLVDPLSGDGMYEAFVSGRLAADETLRLLDGQRRLARRLRAARSTARSAPMRRPPGRRSWRSTASRASRSRCSGCRRSGGRSTRSSAATLRIRGRRGPGAHAAAGRRGDGPQPASVSLSADGTAALRDRWYPGLTPVGARARRNLTESHVQSLVRGKPFGAACRFQRRGMDLDALLLQACRTRRQRHPSQDRTAAGAARRRRPRSRSPTGRTSTSTTLETVLAQVTSMRQTARPVPRDGRARHRLHGLRPAALPRERLPPARRHLVRLPRHPARRCPTFDKLGLPVGVRGWPRRSAASMLVTGRDRLRQDQHARGHGRPHQRLAEPAHRHDRGPDRGPPPGHQLHRQPARGRPRHRVVRAGAAARAAPGPRRDPDRRAPRRRDGADGAAGRGVRPPRLLDDAHDRRRRDGRPARRVLPAAQAAADSLDPRRCAHAASSASGSCRASAAAACRPSR